MQAVVTSRGDFLRELVEQTLIYLRTAVVASLFIALLLVTALWRTTDHTHLILWYAAVALVAGGRLAIYYLYWRSGPVVNPRIWMRALTVGVLAAATVWGSAGLLFFSPDMPQNNVFIAFTLGGLVAAGTGSLAPLQKTMRVFTMLQLGPITLRLLFEGSEMHQAMALMMLFYMVVCMVISAEIHRMLIGSLKLREENLGEIDERRKAEQELRRYHVELEQIVKSRTEELEKINRNLSAEITERREAENRLRLSEERFRGLVENSSDWIWEVDANGAYTYVSPKVRALLGYNPDDLIGRPMFELMLQNEADYKRKMFGNVVARGLCITGLEKNMRHSDGHTVVLECSGEPIRDFAGNVLGYRGVDRDVTERKKLADAMQQKKSLESIGLLAGGIAHDFNNLLVVIFGNMQLAQRHIDADSPAQQLLERAGQAMENARKLTSQLLTFARGGNPVKSILALPELLAETCRLVLSGSAATASTDIADDLWLVDADRGQIWQVLQNLLLNAVEAMPAGGLITITATNVRLDERNPFLLAAGDYVRLAIADQGHGIEEGLLKKIFEPYYSTRHKDDRKGSGLGLTICHSIIKKHNGHIAVASQPGHGAEFTLYLPATANARLPEATPDDTQAAPLPDGIRALVLDDDDHVQNITALMLHELGIECESVSDSRAAVDLFSRECRKQNPYDLVFLDLSMHGGPGGRETLEELVVIEPEVKAIVVSGYADNEVMANHQCFGFKAALVKPYTLEQLESTIRRCL